MIWVFHMQNVENYMQNVENFNVENHNFLKFLS